MRERRIGIVIGWGRGWGKGGVDYHYNCIALHLVLYLWDGGRGLLIYCIAMHWFCIYGIVSWNMMFMLRSH